MRKAKKSAPPMDAGQLAVLAQTDRGTTSFVPSAASAAIPETIQAASPTDDRATTTQQEKQSRLGPLLESSFLALWRSRQQTSTLPSMTPAQVREMTDCFLQAIAQNQWRIHRNVVTCHNCQAAVDAHLEEVIAEILGDTAGHQRALADWKERNETDPQHLAWAKEKG